MDETLALPTEEAVQVALRTQQILAYETGVPNVVDPLGGSYYLESLTDSLEAEAESLFDQVAAVGGVVRALETGWLQRRIAESAARQQWEQEQRRRLTVGVNAFESASGDELTIPLLQIDDTATEQAARLAALRANRDAARAERALARLTETAASNQNVLPAIIDAAKADCTLFEIRSAMEKVFGAYREPVFF
jgi:methylmalonyl-CoA mutase N-terminal domain/subunit